MCGIAGMIDLTGKHPVPTEAVRAMSEALFHRGPDEEGFFEIPELVMANRRLSIVGLHDGRQPISNEDGSVSVVFNGELFDYPQERAALASRGHVFRTHTDTEILPHRYEEHQEGMFERLRGQFAVALWDARSRTLFLARDRFGICPLYFTRVRGNGTDYLLFASEIKALLASRMVEAKPDLRGINHVFTFFALPGPVTCFQGIESLTPGHYLKIQPGTGSTPARVSEHTFWAMDFPDRGDERSGPLGPLVEEFEALLLTATEKRLRADVPVVSYLSGGVDSSTVVSLACHLRKSPIPCFTIRIKDPALDETTEARVVSDHLGAEPVVVDFGAEEVLAHYPRLIQAAEGPVVDTSCAALMLLAQEVHRRGYKVVLTGEGADEWLAGYPWYKISKILSWLDIIPGLSLSQWARRLFVKLSGSPNYTRAQMQRVFDTVGGHNPWLDIYGLMSLNKLRFYSPDLQRELADHIPYADLCPNLERIKRWHPLNRGLFFAGRAHLAGHLLNAKGDRIAMHSSVETRYPFLDEEVVDFLATLHPSLKMKGLREKYILRKTAHRWVPRSVAWRSKAMFRAPFDSFHLDKVPPYVEQLLSAEALQRTGYFDPEGVRQWREKFKTLRPGSKMRISIEMGLAGVFATQLWHQTYIDDSLADVPTVNNAAAARHGAAATVAGAGAAQGGW